MSRGPFQDPPLRVRFPRVSGDEPPPAEGAIRAEEFSPRERG